MRTPASRLWLVSACVAIVSGIENLTFDQSSFIGDFSFWDNGTTVQTSIFNIYPLRPKNFTWTSTVNVTVRNVCLGNEQSGQIVAPEGTSSANSKMRRGGITGDSGIQFNSECYVVTSARMWFGDELIMTPAAASTSNSPANEGWIFVNLVDPETLSSSSQNSPFVFQIQWTEADDDNSIDYYSYSQVWGLAADETVAHQMYDLNSNFSSSASAMAQDTSAFMSISSPTTTVASTTTTSPSPTSSSAESSSTSNSSKKYGLLSKDALIGTIVGGVAFLVLILLVIFLCMRRHRRSNRNQQDDHSRDVQDLMAEKEARAAGTAPDTPYSVDSSQPLNLGRGFSGLHETAGVSTPRSLLAGEGSQRSSAVYSSLRNVTTVGTGGLSGGDGGGGSGSGSVGVENSPTVTHPSSSISLHEPYADLVQDQFERSTSRATAERINSNNIDADTEQTPLSAGSIRDESRPRASGSRTGTPQLGPTRLGRSDTPGGVSISDYLHEDGMTEDEIKRLEEEERALDEAIEQARTDSRAARGK